MRCPHCRSDRSTVIDKRNSVDLTRHRRRRKCGSCGQRWTTVEINVLHSRSSMERELKVEYRRQILLQIKEDLINSINTVFETLLPPEGEPLTRKGKDVSSR